MSFLFDPPLLVASGTLIERAIPEEDRDLAEVATLGVFLGFSIGLYMDVPGLGFLWRPFRAKGGRDFMINSGVFRCKTESAGWKTHAASAVVFATYPFWLKLGRKIGHARTGSQAQLQATGSQATQS